MDKLVRKCGFIQTKNIDEQAYTVDVPVSSENPDTDGDVIAAEGWQIEAYLKHPVLVADHDYYDLRKQIGEAVKVWVDDGMLWAQFKYYADQGNPEADWAWFLVRQGKAAYSVGFRGLSYEPIKDGGFRFNKQELIEISQVVIPANRDAVQAGKQSDNFIIKTIAEAMPVQQEDIDVDTDTQKAEDTPEAEVTKDEMQELLMDQLDVLENKIEIIAQQQQVLMAAFAALEDRVSAVEDIAEQLGEDEEDESEEAKAGEEPDEELDNVATVEDAYRLLSDMLSQVEAATKKVKTDEEILVELADKYFNDK